jgi:glycosyltransferase involved in cell wall biosynthesis
MTARTGLVSLVLPCFNAERFLGKAMESLLRQTHTELEVVAIDDGSTDGTLELLEAFASRDSRVRVLRNEENIGLIRTLNRGVAEARGDFIGRMDADDISTPERIARQLSVLETYPEIGLVGTGVELIDEHGAVIVARPARCVGPDACRYMTLFAPPVVHPSVLARAEVMRRFPYRLDSDSLHAEDYDLWTRMSDGGVRFRNIDEPLLFFRMSSGSVSHSFESIQIRNFAALSKRHIERTLGLSLSRGEHLVVANRIGPEVTVGELVRGLARLGGLRDAFLAESPVGRAARDEVFGITDEQIVDAILQALLKGRGPQRIAAAGLSLRHAGSFLSARGRAYCGLKVRARRSRLR